MLSILWRQAAGNYHASKRFGADASLAILSWRRFGAKPAAAEFFWLQIWRHVLAP
jgi:hypothetical protein